MDHDELIIRLEEKVSFQEQTIAHLDTTVSELTLQMVKLQTRLARLEEQNKTGDDNSLGRQGDTPPPHYGGLHSAV